MAVTTGREPAEVAGVDAAVVGVEAAVVGVAEPGPDDPQAAATTPAKGNRARARSRRDRRAGRGVASRCRARVGAVPLCGAAVVVSMWRIPSGRMSWWWIRAGAGNVQRGQTLVSSITLPAGS